MSASTQGKQNLSQGTVISRSIPLDPTVVSTVTGAVQLTAADAMNPANTLLVAVEVLVGQAWHRTQQASSVAQWSGNPGGELPTVTAVGLKGPSAARLVIETDKLSVGWSLTQTP
jgi:hypothetical protein